jgi:hypothetical protein
LIFQVNVLHVNPHPLDQSAEESSCGRIGVAPDASVARTFSISCGVAAP